MTVSKYQKALNKYIEGWGDLPAFSQHMPDELCTQIKNFENFKEFLRFISKNLDHEKYFEFDAYDTDVFFKQLSKLSQDAELIEFAKNKGIKSDFGFLAYVFILALGEE